ncbi:hypothetical protein D3C71_1661670 [compost metagenome]
MGIAVLRRSIKFILRRNVVVWEINKLMVASAMDLPLKDSYVTLPKDEVDGNNKFWVQRIDTAYVVDNNVHGGLVTEIEVHIIDLEEEE